jgi:hypothetical protein
MIKQLATYLRGWKSYFGFSQTPSVLRQLEEWIRRRLRSMIWKQWKRGKVRFGKLRQRNIRPALAAQTAGSPIAYFDASTRSVFPGCWMYSSSTELNCRMPTRMYGGVAGESGRPLPLCRFGSVSVPEW